MNTRTMTKLLRLVPIAMSSFLLSQSSWATSAVVRCQSFSDEHPNNPIQTASYTIGQTSRGVETGMRIGGLSVHMVGVNQGRAVRVRIFYRNDRQPLANHVLSVRGERHFEHAITSSPTGRIVCDVLTTEPAAPTSPTTAPATPAASEGR